jgi:hypothetical protein
MKKRRKKRATVGGSWSMVLGVTRCGSWSLPKVTSCLSWNPSVYGDGSGVGFMVSFYGILKKACLWILCGMQSSRWVNLQGWRWVNLRTCGVEMTGSVLDIFPCCGFSLNKNLFGFSFIFWHISLYCIWCTQSVW